MRFHAYACLLGAVALTATSIARADTFGTGANTFTIDFVEIGDPGNTNGALGGTGGGSVLYEYRMGVYEIPLSAIDAATASGLQNVSAGWAGGWAADKPATWTNWVSAAAFVNWLNTSTGHHVAYDLRNPQLIDPNYASNGTSGSTYGEPIYTWEVYDWDASEAWDEGGGVLNYTRHKDAYYFLPTQDEWVKSAYYKGNGTNSGYWTYATQSDTAPESVASGTDSGTAVYANDQSEPASVTQAGGLSFYGTMGQNGNVGEFLEDVGLNSDDRRATGGDWLDTAASSLTLVDPTIDPGLTYTDWWGFRVASVSTVAVVPEPSTWAMLAIAFSSWTSLAWVRRARVVREPGF